MNLAIGLAAERNLDVILVDGDVVRGSIAEYFHGDRRGRSDRSSDRKAPAHRRCAASRAADVPGLARSVRRQARRRLAGIACQQAHGGYLRGPVERFQHSIVIFDTPPVLAASEPAAMATHVHHLIMLVAAGRPRAITSRKLWPKCRAAPASASVQPIAPMAAAAVLSYYYYGYGQGNPERHGREAAMVAQRDKQRRCTPNSTA